MDLKPGPEYGAASAEPMEAISEKITRIPK